MPQRPAPHTDRPPTTQTILVVDDEKDLRDIVTRMLNSAGYDVLTAEDGQHAIMLAEHREEPIHCLLTDVKMPQITGPEVAQRITHQHPETAVLYMSGYAAAAMDEQGLLQPGITVLAKPFTRNGLLAAVRGALTQTGTQNP